MTACAPHALGIDIGATNVKLVNVTIAGETLTTREFSTAGDWLPRVAEAVAMLEAEGGRADAIGIAAPGFASPDGKAICWMHGKMSSLVDLDWSRQLGRPIVPVLNDAHAALLGESWLGAARGCRHVIMLTLGTGVGGAVLCDGKLLRGHLGRAGHLGHITVDASGEPDAFNTPGSLEDAIGEYNILQRTGGRFASTRELLDARVRGDKEADRIWLASVRALAAALAGLVNAFDPETIILGGGVAAAGDALFEPLQRMMDQFEWRPLSSRVRIAAAQLGTRAGALGAAWNAMSETGLIPRD